MSEKQLVRSQDDKMLFGVCGGLAEYLNIDPVLVRLFFVLKSASLVNGFEYRELCVGRYPLRSTATTNKNRSFVPRSWTSVPR